MKTKQCANCGAPADNLIQCKYCKTVFFDETDNRLNNVAFHNGFSVSTAAVYPLTSSFHYYGESLVGRRY